MSKLRYDGTACLNLRTIEQAYQFFLPVEQKTPATITLSELLSVLAFLETFITSSRLVYDGTIPTEVRYQAEACIEVLAGEMKEDKFRPEAIKPDSNEAFLADLRTAGAALVMQLEGGLVPLDQADRPLSLESAQQIMNRLERLRQEPAGQSDLALEEAEAGYHGAKMVAALYLAGEPGLMQAVTWLGNQSPQGMALHAAALINRFRLGYVNHLAARKRGVFVPHNALEPVSEQSSELFQQFLLRQMVHHNRDWQELRQAMSVNTDGGAESMVQVRDEITLPPIGLYALMRVKAGDPLSFLNELHQHFAGYNKLFRAMWRTSELGMREASRGTTGPAGDLHDYHAEIAEFFESQSAKLRQNQRLSDPRTGFNRYLGWASATALKVAANTFGSFGLSGLLEQIMQEGVDDLFDGVKDGSLAIGQTHVTQYNKLAEHLNSHMLTMQVKRDLAKRVRKVFKRELIL